MKFKKPIEWLIRESEESGEATLKRSFNAFQLIMLGLGAIIGAGLFSLTGVATAYNAGPAVTISFVLASIACAFSALCYAELASMIPIAGSAYTYTYATLGEWMAWIIAWNLVPEFAFGASAVAISWSAYLLHFLSQYGLYFPERLACSPFETLTLADGSVVHGLINLPAVVVIVCMSMVLIRGTKGSAILNVVMVSLKVVAILLFVTLGWSYINPSNYHPYIPRNEGSFGEYGLSGVLRGASVVFFVFLGFDLVATAAQETKNPRRNMPIGIMGSLAICTVIFVVFGHVLAGLVPYKALMNDAAPVAVAIAKTPYVWLLKAVIGAILLGYTSTIMANLLAQSRVFYSMSKDGLLPRVFSELHPHFRTPWKTNIILCVFVSLIAAFAPMRIMGELTSIGTLLVFAIACACIIILRKTNPDIPRSFKTPLVPLVPILGILSCLAMMVFLPLGTWFRLSIWMGVGVLVYWFYGRKNSLLRKSQKETG